MADATLDFDMCNDGRMGFLVEFPPVKYHIERFDKYGRPEQILSKCRKHGITLEVTKAAHDAMAMHDHSKCNWIFTYAKYHVVCPRCHANTGEPCFQPSGRIAGTPHRERVVCPYCKQKYHEGRRHACSQMPRN